MTLPRLAFLMAIGTLFVGFIGGRSVLGPLLSTNAPAAPVIAQLAPTATSQGTTANAKTPRATPTKTPTPAGTMTVTPTPSPTPLLTPTPTATPTASATPTGVVGSLALNSYWVGQRAVRRGSLVEIGYGIDNPSGKTERVMLGASIKPSTAPSWSSGGISDPSHDVVATVAPGVSTHIRYFVLAAGLRPGYYDVAWGLRDAVTGERKALSFAAEALRVLR